MSRYVDPEELPPRRRSAATEHMLQAWSVAPSRGFPIQRCADCGSLQYPVRDLCRECLSDKLKTIDHDGRGTLTAATNVRHSLEPWFKERGPWPIGMVNLGTGVNILAFLHENAGLVGSMVRLSLMVGPNGVPVPVALPQNLAESAKDDPQLELLGRDVKDLGVGG